MLQRIKIKNKLFNFFTSALLFVCTPLFLNANPLLSLVPPPLSSAPQRPDTISDNVIELFKITGIDTRTTTLQEGVLQVQNLWLRQRGKEHWDQLNRFATLPPLQKQKALAQFEALHMLEEIRPMHPEYDYVILLGSLVPNMRREIEFLLRLKQDLNLKTKKIFVLSGERPLIPKIEEAAIWGSGKQQDLPIRKSWKRPNKLPRTEVEAAKTLFAQTDIPAEWNDQVTFVSTPMQSRNGRPSRPITKDMVESWMKQNPLPGRILAISVNPFSGYQLEVLRTYIPKSFVIDMAGCEADLKETSMDVLFDVLARWMYQLNIRLARQS